VCSFACNFLLSSIPSTMPSATQTSSVRYSRPSDAQAAADAIPILVDGEYHIFHLSTPPNTVRHPPRLRSTWSRLRSRDLVSWTRDEVEALYPGKSRDSPDADGAWTGSAIVGPDGNMHLFYTGYCLAQGGKQVIIHARSSDKQGSAFSKTPSAIRISGDVSHFEDIDFRDAHVSWNEVEGCFWMLGRADALLCLLLRTWKSGRSIRSRFTRPTTCSARSAQRSFPCRMKSGTSYTQGFMLQMQEQCIGSRTLQEVRFALLAEAQAVASTRGGGTLPSLAPKLVTQANVCTLAGWQTNWKASGLGAEIWVCLERCQRTRMAS
jgi:hypothetical protein